MALLHFKRLARRSWLNHHTNLNCTYAGCRSADCFVSIFCRKKDSMSGITVVRTLVPRVSRRFSTSMRTQIENTVKSNQAKFQENDGLPVHLKGGAKDRLVYIAVMGLTGAGTLWACSDLVTMSFK